MKRCRVLAIDPSKRMMHCVFQPPAQKLLAIAIPFTPDNIETFFTTVRCLGITSIYYEACFFGRNTKTYAKLFHAQERMRECARRRGLKFVVVSASTWRRVISIKGEKRAGIKRPEWKRRAVNLSKKILGFDIDNEDLAEAACIWEYARQQELEDE